MASPSARRAEVAAEQHHHPAGQGRDLRVSTAELRQEDRDETVNASTTETLVEAAARLVDELPEGTPPGEVMAHCHGVGARDDAARGMIWPTIRSRALCRKTGIDWHVFPNMSMQHGYSFALVYRFRPAGSDPDRCIFEAAVIELFPEGQEPKTEWVHAATEEGQMAHGAGPGLRQHGRSAEGMKSRAFRGALPNPKQERPVSNFHRNLANYMGTGGPRSFK